MSHALPLVDRHDADSLIAPVQAETHVHGGEIINVGAYPIDALVENDMSTRNWKWRRLFESDGAAPIWLHPDQVLLEQRQIQATDNRPGRIIKATIGSKAVALAILLPKRRTYSAIPGIGPRLGLRGYRLVGSHILRQPNQHIPSAFISALGDQLINDSADFLLAENIEEDGWLWTQLFSLQSRGFTVVLPKGVQPRYQIRFPDSIEDYWNGFSSTSRKTFRRLLRKSEQMRLVRVTQPDQVASFLQDAAAVSAESWQQRHLGCRIRVDDFTAERLESLAHSGALRSYLLYSGDRPVAFEFGVQFKDTFFGEETGFDQRFASSSPGQVLLLREIEDLMSHDRPACFDFGFGDAEYKQHFGVPVGRSADLLLIPPTWRARSKSWLLNTTLSAGRAARSAVERLGLARELRSTFRSTSAN